MRTIIFQFSTWRNIKLEFRDVAFYGRFFEWCNDPDIPNETNIPEDSFINSGRTVIPS